MLKALLKKEFSQLGQLFSFSRQGGKKRSTGAVVGMAILLGFSLLCVLFMFYGISVPLSLVTAQSGADWLYFVLFGIMTLLFGVLGSAFLTNSILYSAHDNEFLLSMPIPPSKILFSRVVMVYLSSLLSCTIVWLPAVINFNVMGFGSVTALIFQILLLFILSALVTVISCLLGWGIALISKRIHNKSFISVILSLVFIGVYYLFIFRMRELPNTILANIDHISEILEGNRNPVYYFGLGACGEVLPFTVFTLAVLLLFALTYFILSKTIFGILTAEHSGKKAVYHEKQSKQSGIFAALIKKEFKRYFSSATYMLNSNLGSFILIIGAIAAIIKADALQSLISEIPDLVSSFISIPAVIAAILCIICSMGSYTCASVSLEGRTIWVLQTMPVAASAVLRAKELMHIILNFIPAIILGVTLAVILQISFVETICIALLVFCFLWFMSGFGLMMNLLKPNLEWTNEAAVIKQGIPATVTSFTGLLLGLIVGGLLYLLALAIGAAPAMLIVALPLAVGALLFDRWISKRGAEIFSTLN